MRVRVTAPSALAAVLIVSGCHALGPGAFGPAQTPTGVGSITDVADGDSRASAQCALVLTDLAQVKLVLRSGGATVTGAFEVTGDQVATYIEAVTDSPKDVPSVWRDKPTKVVDFCIVDGDFYAMTPSMPGEDTSAQRAGIIVEDGVPQLWLVAHDDKSKLPIVDPSTMNR